jgi:hypothetical protein
MRRFWMNAVLLGGLAVILPACGSPGSEASSPAGPAPSPSPTDPQIETFPSEGAMHVPVGTLVVYGTDPPTSGSHYPSPVGGGYYEFPIEAPYLVHSMEHGGVIVYYDPATLTNGQKNDLKALARAHPGVFAMVVCVPRNDPAYPIILTAWTHRLRLPAYDPDRIDGFVTLFLDQGPERAPTNP